MSKNYQKAARGCLYALAVVIAGMCFSVEPAQSATCFLPSGNCSTGKIGGGPAPEATPEYCTRYNINQTQYNQNSKKYSNTSCFSCTSCTKTVDDKGTYYKCDKVSNSTWYDYDGGVCCTNGTKYDTKYKTCCASGDCTPTCPAGQFWSDSSNACVCSGQAVKDKNDNCCASGQVLDDDGNCTTPCKMNACPDGYTYTTDPGNSESCDLGCNKGYRYKCKDGYTYSNGKCEIVPITITINYSLTIGFSGGAPGAGTGWLDMVFNVSSASDAKAHNVLLTFNPMDGAEVTNCTISYPLTIGSDSKTKVQCGQNYSMMNTPELTNVMIDNTNVVSAVRLDQLSKVSVKNDKYIIKFVQNNTCSDYTLTSKLDENCYTCSTCPTDSSKYKCEENVKTGYQLVNGVCTQQGNCESKGKHTSLGSWCSECAKNGTVSRDDDGCYSCKQKCSQKYNDSKYTIIDSTETCSTGFKKLGMGVKDDFNNSCYLCLPMQTCADKYQDPDGYSVVTANDTCNHKLFDLNIKDEAGNECYVCRPAICSDYNNSNDIQFTGVNGKCATGFDKLTFTSISTLQAEDGPCYPCVRPCSYYGYSNTAPSCGTGKYAHSIHVASGLTCWYPECSDKKECIITATTGDVSNESEIYFYGSEEEYNAAKNGTTCIGSMTIKAECKTYQKAGNYTYSRTVLAVNGYESSSTEYHFSNDVIVCSGCSPTVTCKHKWGGQSFTLTGVPHNSSAGFY